VIKVLDFYADWCVPCKQLKPILDEIEKELNYVTVEKINIEVNDEAADLYEIRSVPTLLIFKDNILVDKIIGKVPKNKIINTIEKHK